MTAKGEYFPRRINAHVPDMQYAADVRFGGMGTITIPALLAAAADAILSAQSIATAGETDEFVSVFSSDAMGKFGRNVVVVASGAATSAVTVKGKDYLGQPMTENLTLTGTASVKGKKTFKHIDTIGYAATAAVTIDVGYGDVLGLPYRLIDEISEVVDSVAAASAGTFVAGLAPDTVQSATTGDPRGTYKPAAANVADGSRVYELTCLWDVSNLHGDEQFYA